MTAASEVQQSPYAGLRSLRACPSGAPTHTKAAVGAQKRAAPVLDPHKIEYLTLGAAALDKANAGTHSGKIAISQVGFAIGMWSTDERADCRRGARGGVVGVSCRRRVLVEAGSLRG